MIAHRRGRAGVLLLGLCALLGPRIAHAGGAWLPVRGIRALSMGGAFVAGAEEANALWYNPSRLDKTSVTLDVGGIFLDGSFTAPDGARAQNSGATLPNPTLGAVIELDETFSVGLGVYAPYSPQLGFPEDGPQRYSLVESDQTSKLFMHLALAARIGPVRLGIGVQNVYFHLRQQTVLSGYPGIIGRPTDRDLDVLSELELQDSFTPTGNAGLSVDLGPVTLGLAYQLPYRASGQAKFRVRLGTNAFFDPIVVDGDTAQFAVPFPMSVRAGALWRATDQLRIELAFNWEDWSVQDALVIDPQGAITLRDVPGIGDYEMGPLVVDRRMKDTYSVHLGGDYQVISDLSIRAGAFFETSSFDDVTYSVAQLDSTKVGAALGLAYQWRWFRIDAAVSYVHQMPRSITNSELVQINPTNQDQAVVVGNGDHASRAWIAGLGLVWRLDG